MNDWLYFVVFFSLDPKMQKNIMGVGGIAQKFKVVVKAGIFFILTHSLP